MNAGHNPVPTAHGLDAIRLPETNPSTNPDTQTLAEQNSLDAAHRRAVIEGLKQDIGERKTYARRIFVLICSWLGAVFLIIAAQGIGWHFALPGPVLLAVIGSTTINVLGIFYIVTHYLFPNR